MTKRELENIIDNILFETKGILEREDYAKQGSVGYKKSPLWKVIVHRMKDLQKRNKNYKFVVDIIKSLDKYYDKVGLDGFE